MKINLTLQIVKGMITICLLLLTSSLCNAQLELKPAIGINGSRFNTDPKDSLGAISGRPGWQFGGTILYGKKWYVESGFFIQYQGHELQTIDQNSQSVLFSNDIKSMYLPFNCGYHILGNEEGLFGLRLFAGASWQSITHIDSEVPDLNLEDVESPIWGVYGGLGVNFWLIYADLSYQWDLTNTYVNSMEDKRNHIIRANLGARINF
jgi:hypothetical protein